MTIAVVIDNKPIDVKFLTFSDGGEYLKLDLPEFINESINVTIKDEPAGRYVWLSAMIQEVFANWEDKHGDVPSSVSIGLNLPFFPFARADRVFEEGMGSPLSVFLSFLENNTPFDTVYTNDIHNRIPQFDEGLTKYEEKGQTKCFKETVERVANVDILQKLRDKSIYLVAPDKGAVEKTRSIADYYGVEFAVCDKRRNPTTAYIESIDFVEPFEPAGKDMLIVDDLCDGGATFAMTGDMLKRLGAKSVTLYVTHGIFAKGLQPLKVMDKIMCYQTVMNYVTMEDVITFGKNSILK